MGDDDSGGGLGGGIAMIFMMLLLFPLMLYGYGIKQTLADAFTSGYGSHNLSSYNSMGLEIPEIEIT